MARSKTVIWQPAVGDRVLTTPAATSDMTGLSRIERVTEVNPRRIITTSGRIFGLATLVSPIDEAYAEGCELRICKLTPELEARFAAFCVWQKQIIDLTDFSWADLKPEQLHHIHTQVMQNDAGILPGRGCSRLCSRNQSKIIEVPLRKVCGDFTLNVRHMDN